LLGVVFEKQEVKPEISLLKLWKLGKFSRIIRNENYLYLTTYDNKIKIVDIQDINDIKVVGEIQIDLESSDHIRSIVYDNGYLYVAEDKYINIINVKKASAPKLEKEFKISGQSISNTVVLNHQLYVSYWGSGEGKIDKFDLSKPTNPLLKSSLITHLRESVFNLKVDGNYLYILYEKEGMEIIDISKDTIKFVSYYKKSGWFKDLEIKGSKAYIADWKEDNIFIIDISNKSNPKALTSVSTNESPSYISLVGEYTLWEDRRGLELGSRDFTEIKTTYSTIENFSYIVYKNYILGVNSNGLKVFEVTPSSLFDSQDSDGDGYNDDEDAFPNDKNEWLDTDGDCIGNNADKDDDGDGISDVDEAKYGLDSLDASDAIEDADGDGVSNIDEIKAGTNPNNEEDMTRSRIYYEFEIGEWDGAQFDLALSSQNAVMKAEILENNGISFSIEIDKQHTVIKTDIVGTFMKIYNDLNTDIILPYEFDYHLEVSNKGEVLPYVSGALLPVDPLPSGTEVEANKSTLKITIPLIDTIELRRQ